MHLNMFEPPILFLFSGIISFQQMAAPIALSAIVPHLPNTALHMLHVPLSIFSIEHLNMVPLLKDTL